MALAFDRQIEAFAKKTNMSVDRAIRGTSIKLFSAIILASPVDTGRFRANWQASNERPASGTTFSEDKSGSGAINNVTTYINGAPFANEFTLANNLPYAYKLEFGGYTGDGPNTVGGYSTQAPQGMVRINVARFQRILDEQARINR